jgi:Raffinose synthase or seed imbibition protein Sip1
MIFFYLCCRHWHGERCGCIAQGYAHVSRRCSSVLIQRPALFAILRGASLLQRVSSSCYPAPCCAMLPAGCGVDGVKVDVQGTSGMFHGGPQASQRYHESLEASVAQSFPGNMLINCMVRMACFPLHCNRAA